MVLDGSIEYEDYLESNRVSLKGMIDERKPDMVVLDSELDAPIRRRMQGCRREGRLCAQDEEGQHHGSP